MRPLSRVRILHVDYGMGFGGSIVSLSELVRGLRAEADVHSTVVSFQPLEGLERLFPHAQVRRERLLLSYQERARLDQWLKRAQWRRVLRWPTFKVFAAIDALHDRWLARRLARIGRRCSATHVHANNGWSMSAVHAARALGVPCVVHFRGYEPSSLSGAERAAVNRRSRQVFRCIGIAPAVSASIVASGVPEAMVATVDNPVTLEQYEVPTAVRDTVRARHGLAPHAFVVGLFGRVIPFKGQLEFLDAIRPLMIEWPALHVLIVGDESDLDLGGYGQRVREAATHADMGGRVLLAGYQERVAEYYAACDAVVHCSVHPEPFGRVVIESMAAERPVVAMNEGGPPEIITHDVDGLLVAPRDGRAMCEALRRLRDEPLLRERLAVQGRETVRARYTPQAAARRFLTALGIPPSAASPKNAASPTR
jgi:glycosyltransferase involved in cell wall biosynthesis